MEGLTGKLGTHVDDFIDDHSTDNYVSFVLNWFRAPAIMHARYDEWMERFKLFCVYQNTMYRVTGASRMGDIWLASDFNRKFGYDIRVCVDDCSHWCDDGAKIWR